MTKDGICNAIRERIVNLEYKPGDYLYETKIAKEFGVSRTPIREIFILLSTENLLSITPNSGVRVSDINLRDFHELIGYRIILEKGAARLAAMNSTDDDIKELLVLRERINAIDSEDTMELIGCDTRFHEILRRATRNRLLDRNLLIVQQQFTRIQRLMEHKPDMMPFHLDTIIEALGNRDGAKIEECLVDHVNHFVSVVRSYFK